MQIRKQLPEARRLWVRPERHNMNKYYLYHYDHSHNTEECIQLQDEIEGFIHHGRLDRFLINHKKRLDAQEALPCLLGRLKKPTDHPTEGNVNTILRELVEEAKSKKR